MSGLNSSKNVFNSSTLYLSIDLFIIAIANFLTSGREAILKKYFILPTRIEWNLLIIFQSFPNLKV